MRKTQRLTFKFIDAQKSKLAAGNKLKGRFADGNGLCLQVSKYQTLHWVLRFQYGGRNREMGLGPLSKVTLAQARKDAAEAHLQIRAGKDPIDEREAKAAALRAEASRRIRFREAAEKYIASHQAGWKNKKSADQWTNTLLTYAHPIVGELDCADVETGHVMQILEPIWATIPDTASRIRGRVENILDWAKTRGYRKGENPARWRGHLQNLLPKKSKVRRVKHQPALPIPEMPAFMAALRGNPAISARALEFTILCAARTNEVVNVTWEELDLETKLWVVPAERMKSGREHRVPLSKRALEILESLPREAGSRYVFPGSREKKPLSNMAMLMLIRGMRPGVTVHGSRSTFRDWVGEFTSFPEEVAEAALAHVNGDATEAAYRRMDALNKRRELMEAWSNYCKSDPSSQRPNVVVPIRKTA